MKGGTTKQDDCYCITKDYHYQKDDLHKNHKTYKKFMFSTCNVDEMTQIGECRIAVYFRRFHVFSVRNTKIANVHFAWLDDNDPDVDLFCKEIIVSHMKALFDKTDIVIGDFNYSSEVLQKLLSDNFKKLHFEKIGESITDNKTLERNPEELMKQRLMELKLEKLNIMQKQLLQNLQKSEQVAVSNESQQDQPPADIYKQYTGSASKIKIAYKNNEDFPIFDHKPVELTKAELGLPFDLITINVGATFPTWHDEIRQNYNTPDISLFSEWQSRHVIQFLQKNFITGKKDYVVCLQEVNYYMYTEFTKFVAEFTGKTLHVSEFHMYFEYIVRKKKNTNMDDENTNNPYYLSYGLFSFSDAEINDDLDLQLLKSTERPKPEYVEHKLNPNASAFVPRT